MSNHRKCHFCHAVFSDYKDRHDARNCPAKQRCGKVDNGRVCVLAIGHDRNGSYCASLEGNMLVPWGGVNTKPRPKPAFITESIPERPDMVEHAAKERSNEAEHRMCLEIVSVWVLRWSESCDHGGQLPATRCIFTSEKAAKDAREEWIRAIAEKRGVDADGASFAADQLRREWRIDQRFALKAMVDGDMGEWTRFFLLDDVSGNMVHK